MISRDEAERRGADQARGCCAGLLLVSGGALLGVGAVLTVDGPVLVGLVLIVAALACWTVMFR